MAYESFFNEKPYAMLIPSTRKYLFFLLFSFLINGLAAQPAFTDVTVAKGITDPLNPVLPLEHDGADVNDVMYVGSGAAWLDFNGDGFLDIYITMRDGANHLYQNSGPPNYDFSEVAGSYNIQDVSGDGNGLGVADFDNDGDPDIYICNTNVDRLYRNDGTTFTDITSSAGLSTTNESRSNSVSWGDYDKDGYLDFYVSRHKVFIGNSGTRQDQLYHNNGDGTFTDVSSLLDVSLLMGPGFIGGFVDFDNDKDLDIIVINDCKFVQEEGRTRIFRNDGGTDGVNDWTFTEVAASVGVDDCSNGMGIAVGDINHDGFQDFANSDIGVINFWLNSNGTYTDIAASAGVDNQNAGHYSWGANLFDYNNDGWLDFFVVSGSLQFSSNVDPQPNYFYENNGTTGETFTDKSALLDMDDNEISRNSVAGDFDNDGDLDMLILNYDEAVMLKQNNNVTNNWIKVQLTGMFDIDGAGYSNKDGVGAKVRVATPDGKIQTFETRAGSSLGGSEQNVAHFGLGANTTISELKVTWPCGNIQTVNNINSVNTTLYLIETPDAPLSVELLSFEAKQDRQEVILEWLTESEVSNAYFNVQRSTDGRNFEKIGQVAGNGNTTSISSYVFVDESPLIGENYYRLEQTDYDGKTSFSPIEWVQIKNQEATLQVLPNPVSKGSFEAIYNTQDRAIVLTLLDVFGKVIQQENITHDGHESSKTISTEGLAGGMYILRLSGQTGQQVVKVIVR